MAGCNAGTAKAYDQRAWWKLLVEAAARDLEGFSGFKGLNNGLKAGKRQA